MNKLKTYTKDEYSEVFNAIFGTNINWKKLSREELVQLATVLNNPEILLNRLGVKASGKIVRDKLVDATLEFVKRTKLDGPIANFIKSFLENKYNESE